MGKKGPSDIRGIGQLPGPKTVNVPSLVEDMWEVYRDTVGSCGTDDEIQAYVVSATIEAIKP